MWRVVIVVVIASGCGADRPESKPAAPPPSHPLAATADAATERITSWWCFTAAPAAGACRPTRAECEALRDILQAKARESARTLHEVSKCESQEHAWCFQLRPREDPSGLVCAPTQELCDRTRTATLQQAPPEMRVESICALE